MALQILSMKRPRPVHFLSVVTDHNINIRASFALQDNVFPPSKTTFFGNRIPLRGLLSMESRIFMLKFVGFDKEGLRSYEYRAESDDLGNLQLKIPLMDETQNITSFRLFETGYAPGLELYMGTFAPLFVRSPKKIVVCDFDKTLLETQYASLRELYHSLTTPLESFTPLEHSHRILKSRTDVGFIPFIVSSSPHFYEDAIRNWLYSRGIYTAGIFLKDYRRIFSLFDLNLTAKDIKSQGAYKLSQLIDILLMTEIPDQLVLIGDNFESDPVIYLTLAMILFEDYEPWHIWNELKTRDSFKLNKKQDADFLNKIYLLSGFVEDFRKAGKGIRLSIYIRRKGGETEVDVPEFFRKHQELIELYDGNP